MQGELLQGKDITDEEIRRLAEVLYHDIPLPVEERERLIREGRALSQNYVPGDIIDDSYVARMARNYGERKQDEPGLH